MIGVITKENVYPLLIELSNSKKTNVYWYNKDDINLGIERLKEKNCEIIITDLDYSKINNSEIKFINLNIEPDSSKYIIDSKELINAVKKSNEEKVLEILNNLDIPKDKDIIITNQILILIKHIIKEKFSNNVITINDIILKNIPNGNEEGQIYLIN